MTYVLKEEENMNTMNNGRRRIMQVFNRISNRIQHINTSLQVHLGLMSKVAFTQVVLKGAWSNRRIDYQIRFREAIEGTTIELVREEKRRDRYRSNTRIVHSGHHKQGLIDQLSLDSILVNLADLLDQIVIMVSTSEERSTSRRTNQIERILFHHNTIQESIPLLPQHYSRE